MSLQPNELVLYIQERFGHWPEVQFSEISWYSHDGAQVFPISAAKYGATNADGSFNNISTMGHEGLHNSFDNDLGTKWFTSIPGTVKFVFTALPSSYTFTTANDNSSTGRLMSKWSITTKYSERVEDHVGQNNDAGNYTVNPGNFEVFPNNGTVFFMDPTPTCFPTDTPVQTDQGVTAIDKLVPGEHTIRGKSIIAITQTRPLQKHIVCFEKDSIGKNVPSQQTLCSKEHKVLYQGEMIKARDITDMCKNVKKVAYNGETLYNVLLEKHGKMLVNNMICETLHPENIAAKFAKSKNTTKKNVLLK